MVDRDCVLYEPSGANPDWYAVVGHSFLAAVEAAAGAQVAWRLWELAAHRSVSIEDAVGVLPLMPGAVSFALARFADGGPAGSGSTVTVIVRGDAAVDVHRADGTRRFTADGIEPWLIADFRACRAIAVQSARIPPAAAVQASSAALPIAFGVVPADRVLWSRSRGEVIRGAVPTPAPRGLDAAGGYLYRVPGHEAIRLEAPTVFGRRPSSAHRRVPEAARLVTLTSRTGSVSGSHVLISHEDGALIVTDLDSTNGTKVTQAGARRVRLRPGQSVAVPGAARVDVGDGNIIEVMPARTDDADGPSAASDARGSM